ncbi:Methyltransferase domain-containing protein [Palleronia marisminoris]|uniref:class I SAM-dependent methyltransferase n=1 Tax=Palleronia marisminoris TaxID=315423 RepID=UPI0008EA4BF8|nr:class I SAM-dependent methyltransferase [Palleronia marisminoris]SFH29331.1 Methyltransferase domain-containing protein [Palleronia marisminoris]
MRFYDRHILPRLTHLAMRQDLLLPYRRRAVSSARGRVLEIGIGSGLNLPLYPDSVDHVVGVDPSPELLSLAGAASRSNAREVGIAENLPLEDRSVDCVVTSWTLCSVTDPRQALSEIRRVLKPGGMFSFVEHGLAPEARVQKWQHRLTPIWSCCAGNCHLNRTPAALVEESGLQTERLETGYAAGPKPVVFMYEGLARRA